MSLRGALLRLALRQLPVVVLRVTMHVDLRIFCLNCLAASVSETLGGMARALQLFEHRPVR